MTQSRPSEPAGFVPGPALGHVPRAQAQCIKRLIADTARLVARVARRFGVRECDVDDVSQRVYLTFLRRASVVREGAERSFLVAITTREAAHQRRGYRRCRELSGDELSLDAHASDRPDVLARQRQAQAAVASILESMEEPLRRVLVGFELEQRTLGELALELGVPLGTVKSRLQRARAVFTAEAQQRLSRSSWVGGDDDPSR